MVSFLEYRENKAFIFFWGCGNKNKIQKGCFSQWWPCRFNVDGIEYNSAEQYMMAQKAKTFRDEKIFSEILKTADPRKIKELGRKVSGFNSAVWNRVKFDIVVKGNYAKFSQNGELRKFLINTGNATIAEASPKDSVWGIGMSEYDADVYNMNAWRGQNLLGKAIMKVRSALAGGGIIAESTVGNIGGGGLYWSRINDPGVTLAKKTSVNRPCFISRDIGRTKFYYADKNKKSYGPGHFGHDGYTIDVIEVDQSLNICDLTNPDDCASAGIPGADIIFKRAEPYFAFNLAVAKDKNLVPAEFTRVCRLLIDELYNLDRKKYSYTPSSRIESNSVDGFTTLFFDRASRQDLSSAFLNIKTNQKLAPIETAYISLLGVIRDEYDANRQKIQALTGDASSFIDRFQLVLFYKISKQHAGFYCKEVFRDRRKIARFPHGKYGRSYFARGTPLFPTIAFFSSSGFKTVLSCPVEVFEDAKNNVNKFDVRTRSDIDYEYAEIIKYVKSEPDRKKAAEEAAKAAEEAARQQEMKQREEQEEYAKAKRLDDERKRLDDEKRELEQHDKYIEWCNEKRPHLYWVLFISASDPAVGYAINVVSDSAVNAKLNAQKYVDKNRSAFFLAHAYVLNDRHRLIGDSIAVQDRTAGKPFAYEKAYLKALNPIITYEHPDGLTINAAAEYVCRDGKISWFRFIKNGNVWRQDGTAAWHKEN